MSFGDSISKRRGGRGGTIADQECLEEYRGFVELPCGREKETYEDAGLEFMYSDMHLDVQYL